MLSLGQLDGIHSEYINGIFVGVSDFKRKFLKRLTLLEIFFLSPSLCLWTFINCIRL